MKQIFTLLFCLFIGFSVFGQDEMTDFPLAHNVLSNVQFSVYEIPLKIKQVNTQTQIDYSKPAGILQSFYSASNLKWAMSEYLKSPEKIVRDQGHFDAIKKRDVQKNYVQLETIYYFQYNNRQFAFLKYAIVDERLPFQLLGVLSIEKVKNRWYISYLFNQNQVSTLLVNFDTSVLLNLFEGLPVPNIEEKLTKSMQMSSGKFSFAKTDRIFGDLIDSNDKKTLKNLKDKRNVDETFKPKLAIENAKLTEYKYELPHPFLMDSTNYVEYSEKDSVLADRPENLEQWQNMPELLLTKEAKAIRMINKFSFISENKKYFILTYYSTKRTSMVFIKENGVDLM